MEKQEMERSEEIRDIIDRMPTRWSGWIALVVGGLMGVVLLLGYLIKYPDTVDGQISITGTHAPIRLLAGTNGRIHLMVSNRARVKEGDLIAYIENGADMDDIQTLEQLVGEDIRMDTELTLPTGLELGDLSSVYNSFLLSYRVYDQYRKSELYTNMKSTLLKQIDVDGKVADNLKRELKLVGRIVANEREHLKKDSLLLLKGGISKLNYDDQHNALLAQEETEVGLQSSHLSKLSDINKNKLEIDRLNIEESETLQKAYESVLVNYNELMNQLNVWKIKYLLIAPEGGDLEYLGFWRENTHVQVSEELFTILPEKNEVIGEVYMTSVGAGKVKSGQEANVILTDYPYDEYGLLKGRVQNVSQLTNTISTQNGTVETYLVTVTFPDGLRTNFGKQLSLNFETKGSIEIITKPKRLIQRLFDNLKAKSTK